MNRWWGKLIGLIVGFALRGPVGAVLGALVGHAVDQALGGGGKKGYANVQARTVFFDTLFAIMGHLLKADGRVSEQEIAAAESIMARMQLDAGQRRQAIERFQHGKRIDFQLEQSLHLFRQFCGNHPELQGMLLELLADAALADGAVTPAERDVFSRIARSLGISHADLDHLLHRSGAHWRDSASTQQQKNNQQQGKRSARTVRSRPDPYRVLGVARTATASEIKRAYRKEISRHHPDKLASQGLPKEMLVVADEKTREIRAAYDWLRDKHQIK
jgi:DnaJ like chaperone protein